MQDAEGRIKTIFAFSRKNISQTTSPITMEDGSETDRKVGEYLHTTYPSLPTKHFDLKAVNLGNKENESWFAPEHLKILQYQLYSRPVPDHLTESMLKIANRTPA
jgi:hypothetical protein